MLDNLFDWLSNSNIPTPLKAGIWHHQFVYIHPFLDGNGRTCRLLTALIFLKENYLINKYFVLDDYYDIDRPQYSEKLHTADNGDKTTWLEYFTDGVKYSLQGALAKAKNALSTVTISQQPTAREKEVLEMFKEYTEISSAILVKRLKMSRQQAHKLLSSLVERGLVKKIGSTKSSYYTLA
jgi:Fic family protein